MGNFQTCEKCNHKVYSQSKICQICRKELHRPCLYLVHKVNPEIKNLVKGYERRDLYELISMRYFEKNVIEIKKDRVNYDYQCEKCYDKYSRNLYYDWFFLYEQSVANQRIRRDRQLFQNRLGIIPLKSRQKPQTIKKSKTHQNLGQNPRLIQIL